MSTNNLKEKKLALFFTSGMSLKVWHDKGMIDREVALYNHLSKYYKSIYIFTYGNLNELEYKKYFNNNVYIVTNKYNINRYIYSILMLILNYKILREIDILKTHQMSGSWSAVLSKIIFRKILIIRTGFMWSTFSNKVTNRIRYIIKIIEKISYSKADAIISASLHDFNYVNEEYHPKGNHIIIQNYVETDVFKPLPLDKEKNTLCFIGRLEKQKNLFALFEALKNTPYKLYIVGTGSQMESLKKFAKDNQINVIFLGNIPNHELPKIICQHEIFILPSYYEGMPKTLLEAMACGVPVIGTDVEGINEVIVNNYNGLLCEIDPISINNAINMVMNDEILKKTLGENARDTILRNYCLSHLVMRELDLAENLFNVDSKNI